jgi:hypothetical protein
MLRVKQSKKYCFTLKMKALPSFETSETTHPITQHFPEYVNLHLFKLFKRSVNTNRSTHAGKHLIKKELTPKRKQIPLKYYRIIGKAQHYQNHERYPETCGSSAMYLKGKLVRAKDVDYPFQKSSAIMLPIHSRFHNLVVQQGLVHN